MRFCWKKLNRHYLRLFGGCFPIFSGVLRGHTQFRENDWLRNLHYWSLYYGSWMIWFKAFILLLLCSFFDHSWNSDNFFGLNCCFSSLRRIAKMLTSWGAGFCFEFARISCMQVVLFARQWALEKEFCFVALSLILGKFLLTLEANFEHCEEFVDHPMIPLVRDFASWAGIALPVWASVVWAILNQRVHLMPLLQCPSSAGLSGIGPVTRTELVFLCL